MFLRHVRLSACALVLFGCSAAHAQFDTPATQAAGAAGAGARLTRRVVFVGAGHAHLHALKRSAVFTHRGHEVVAAVRDDGKWRVIRRRQTLEDVLALEE